MTSVILTVNGAAVRADVAPRMHLADFLREELLLTGTHLGCEHGVCGACTVLLDGEPVRACITYAAACDGRDVRSIEGLDDEIAAALRNAFTAEHALQCGFCTPGMLVTARDIVRRLPHADDARIRLELAGNLCRCTGYIGIVRAIRRVLEARPDVPPPSAAPIPAGRFAAVDAAATVAAPPAASAVMPEGEGLRQEVRLALPPDIVWQAVRDPALVAGCVPGARLLAIDGERIRGEILMALGPIEARFAGDATVTYDDAGRSGRLAGTGLDPASGTRVTGTAEFCVRPDGASASILRIDVVYALRGALAQFGRGPILRVLAAEMAATVARNLEARLRGDPAPVQPARLRAGRLIVRSVWRWLRSLWSRPRV